MAITTTSPDAVCDHIAKQGGPMKVFVDKPLREARAALRRATDHLAAGQRKKAVPELREMERLIDEALKNGGIAAGHARRMAKALRQGSPMTGGMHDLVWMWIGGEA